MSSLFEYCITGAGDSPFYGPNWRAQTFTPAISHLIMSVKLKMFRAGTPGTITVSIRATDIDHKPAGDDLCVGTTNGNTLTTDVSGEWREITFNTYANLNAGVQYAIVTRAITAVQPNDASWMADYLNSYGGGYLLVSENSGNTWDPSTGDDCLFEDWGNRSSTPIPCFFRS